MEWTHKDSRIPVFSWCRDVEKQAMEQALNLAELKVTYKHIALMPDCHVGYGMPIGGVAAVVDAVIPNAVGVDIGCGVVAARTDVSESSVSKGAIKRVMGQVRQVVPTGFGRHRSSRNWEGFERAPLSSAPVKAEIDSARKQLGTLGGGNHFIELQTGDDGFLWLMIHSGSRNFGLKIAEYYHAMALRFCEKHKVQLSSKDLAYFPMDNKLAEEYLAAMRFALDFAKQNRAEMLAQCGKIVCDVFKCSVRDTIDIHHNYCNVERHFGRDVYLHRKGATSARLGERGIIPGSMGTSSYIVRGLGNPDSFESCSHGAGRRMGRKEANRVLSEVECTKDMEDVVFGRWSRDRKGRLDLSEAPRAYKDIDEVMSAQRDLVEIVVKLKPVGVVKG